MKRIFLLINLTILAMATYAYDFCVDDIYYNVLASGSEVEVTHGNDESNIAYASYRGVVEIPEIVSYENTTYTVTAVGESAFRKSNRLSSIVLPNSIKRIGDKAFYYCTRITKLDIPESVEHIGEWVFYGCNRLKELIIPASVKFIGSKAFWHCTALPEIVVADANAHYCAEDGVLYNKDKSYVVTAFPSFTGIFTMPATVTEIGEYAFNECKGLTEIVFNKSLKKIGAFAFFGCTSLTTLELPQSLETIETGAFFLCDKLTTITAGEALKSIEDRAFSHIRSLTDLNLSSKFLKIGKYAFSNCSKLTIKSLPEGLVEIDDWAFMGCIKMRSLALPQSLTRIGDYTFMANPQLSKLELGYELAQIGTKTFEKSDRVRQLYITAVTPPVIDATTFPESITRAATLFVPTGCKSLYETAAYWQKFANIEEYETAVVSVKDDSRQQKVYASNGRLYVEGVANDKQIDIYNTNGVCLYSISANDLKQIKLSKGIYVIRLGDNAYKVAI